MIDGVATLINSPNPVYKAAMLSSAARQSNNHVSARRCNDDRCDDDRCRTVIDAGLTGGSCHPHTVFVKARGPFGFDSPFPSMVTLMISGDLDPAAKTVLSC